MQGPAQPEPGHGISGFQRKRFPVKFYGFRQPVIALPQHGQLQDGVLVAGEQGNGFFELRGGLVVAAQPGIEHTQLVAVERVGWVERGRRPEIVQRLIRVAQGLVDGAGVHFNVGPARVQTLGREKIHQGFGVKPGARPYYPPQLQGHGIARVQLQGLLELVQRLVRRPEPVESRTVEEPGPGVLRVLLGRLEEFIRRRRVILLAHQGVAAAQVDGALLRHDAVPDGSLPRRGRDAERRRAQGGKAEHG